MEPTSVMIGAAVSYLSKKLKDNESINDFFKDFTSATVNWLRPIFLKEDKPKEVLENLRKDPLDDLNQKDAATAMERGLRQNPEAEKYLREIYETIKGKEAKGESVSIINSKNVVTGKISSGRDVIVGDNNNAGSK